MQAVLSRRSCVRVRCEDAPAAKDHKCGDLGKQVQQVRKTLVAEKKRLEEMRSTNFKTLAGALKQMVDDEVAFMRSIYTRGVEKPRAAASGVDTDSDEEERNM